MNQAVQTWCPSKFTLLKIMDFLASVKRKLIERLRHEQSMHDCFFQNMTPTKPRHTSAYFRYKFAIMALHIAYRIAWRLYFPFKWNVDNVIKCHVKDSIGMTSVLLIEWWTSRANHSEKIIPLRSSWRTLHQHRGCTLCFKVVTPIPETPEATRLRRDVNAAKRYTGTKL